MDRFVICLAAAVAFASAGPAYSEPEPAPSAASDAFIIQAKDHAELTKKFARQIRTSSIYSCCPPRLFVDSEQLICDGGPYKLYRIIEHDDHG